MVIPELPSYSMCPSIVHSSTWNGLNYPEYITELNLVETGGGGLGKDINFQLIGVLMFEKALNLFLTG